MKEKQPLFIKIRNLAFVWYNYNVSADIRVPGTEKFIIFQYRLYKDPPSVPILSQINPIHASPLNALKIYFNVKCVNDQQAQCNFMMYYYV
jgi:hypothetical protein